MNTFRVFTAVAREAKQVDEVLMPLGVPEVQFGASLEIHQVWRYTNSKCNLDERVRSALKSSGVFV
jgi:hypothetical protein